MKTEMKALVLLIALLALALAGSVHATCNNYPDSTPKDFDLQGSGAACAEHGSGCTECIDYNQYGSGKSCVRDWYGFVEYCYYWGQDYQTF